LSSASTSWGTACITTGPSGPATSVRCQPPPAVMVENRIRRVQVLSRGNGAGLSRDLELVACVLRQAGCTVTMTELSHRDTLSSRLARLGRRLRDGLRALGPVRASARYDLNLMLERVYPDRFGQARRNVLIPNPEWLRQ